MELGAQGRLWLETPDSASRTSLGRYGSLAEAEGQITVLAIENRVGVRDLGNVQTVDWT